MQKGNGGKMTKEITRNDLLKVFRDVNDILRAEGVRSGIEQFNEFTNILFLKLLSESGESSYWSRLKELSNDKLISEFNEAIISDISTRYNTKILTTLTIKNPQTLKHIIDSLDAIEISDVDTDIKGDAFEFFINSATSDGGLGEYYTPREIVKTVVKLANPKLGEKIYDPFCGTGGFLISAYKHIVERHKKDPLEVLHTIGANIPEGINAGLNKKLIDFYLRERTIYAGEISQNARIARMNMLLQGEAHYNIQQIDSLANPIDGLYDVIITNIPFSQKLTSKTTIDGKTKIVNDISPLYYNGLAKNNGDATCVLHCLRALKEGGRMAVIVPEGFLFRNDIAKVREFLLSRAKLQGVISLPQGTFLPYTGVKTSVLYFTDAHMPNTQKEYWFFEAKNIGMTLNNHKRKIEGLNDLDKLNNFFEKQYA